MCQVLNTLEASVTVDMGWLTECPWARGWSMLCEARTCVKEFDWLIHSLVYEKVIKHHGFVMEAASMDANVLDCPQ